MSATLLVIHLIITLAMIILVLLQRSEGGGLGIGGGSGFMTARGAANALTRTTAILGAGFFATSLLLGIIAMNGERPTDILNRIPAGSSQTAPAGGNGILDQLGGGTTTPESTPAQPAAPASQVPSSQ